MSQSFSDIEIMQLLTNAGRVSTLERAIVSVGDIRAFLEATEKAGYYFTAAVAARPTVATVKARAAVPRGVVGVATAVRKGHTRTHHVTAPGTDAYKLYSLLAARPRVLRDLNDSLKRSTESVLAMVETLRAEGHVVVEERIPVKYGRGYKRVFSLGTNAAERVTSLK